MTLFKKLTVEEKEAILRFPVYLTLLADNRDGILNESEKNCDRHFLHNKTYCDPLLSEFYIEVDKVFASTLEKIDKELPIQKEKRDAAINKELMSVEKIVMKLGKEYTLTMHRSMKSFKEHLFRTHHGIFLNFSLPI
jgi:hypothetical protein